MTCSLLPSALQLPAALWPNGRLGRTRRGSPGSWLSSPIDFVRLSTEWLRLRLNYAVSRSLCRKCISNTHAVSFFSFDSSSCALLFRRSIDGRSSSLKRIETTTSGSSKKGSSDCFQNTPRIIVLFSAEEKNKRTTTESTKIVILDCMFHSTELLPLSIRPTITELCGQIPEPKHSGKQCNCSDSANPSAVRTALYPNVN